jgi:hypothetical protein
LRQRADQARHHSPAAPARLRTVLLDSNIGGALALLVVALLHATTPTWITALILVLSGIPLGQLQRVQLPAVRDIGAADLADANTLSSTLSRVAAALGVAVEALLLPLSDQALGAPASRTDHRLRPDLRAAAQRSSDATAGPGAPAASNSRRRANPPLASRPDRDFRLQAIRLLVGAAFGKGSANALRVVAAPAPRSATGFGPAEASRHTPATDIC